MATAWLSTKCIASIPLQLSKKGCFIGLTRQFRALHPVVQQKTQTYCARSALLKHLSATNALLHQNHNFTTTSALRTESTQATSLKKSPDYSIIDEDTIVQKINNAVNERDSRLFAVVHLCGKQFKITTEDIFFVRLHFDPTVGDKIKLEKVLMVGGKDFTMVGQPILSRDLVNIEATVVEKSLSHYRVDYRYKKRHRKRFFKLKRDMHTMMVVNNIEVRSLES